MARWIALAMTLLLMGSCSLISTSVYRGMVAPIGAVLFSCITVYLFIHDRVASRVRSPAQLLMDADTQRLLRAKAEREKAAEQAQSKEADDDPPTGATT